MKKYLLLITVPVILANCLFFSSCKKTTHYPHPSPGGVRLASYSMVIATNTLLPGGIGGSENDNYSFTYDTLNRVIKEVFTTNNPAKPNENITFTYSNDTVYKITSSVAPIAVLETDTFILNSQGQLTLAFTPGIVTSFQYYENLLTSTIVTSESTLKSVTNTYTSVVGNFLNGISSVPSPIDQTFTYYTDYDNRVGDYLQINSFTMYGYNVYQYKNLIHTITGPTGSTSATYNIDAFSNITSSTVSSITIPAGYVTTQYTFQYQNY